MELLALPHSLDTNRRNGSTSYSRALPKEKTKYLAQGIAHVNEDGLRSQSRQHLSHILLETHLGIRGLLHMNGRRRPRRSDNPRFLFLRSSRDATRRRRRGWSLSLIRTLLGARSRGRRSQGRDRQRVCTRRRDLPLYIHIRGVNDDCL